MSVRSSYMSMVLVGVVFTQQVRDWLLVGREYFDAIVLFRTDEILCSYMDEFWEF